jgi:hypothetical protein
VGRDAALRALVSRLDLWSGYGLGRPLRPYQREAAAAILRSIREGAGDVLTVMMSRQAGKNELSAQLESFLLASHQRAPETIVKAAPTFKPQIINSLLRLQQMLEASPLTAGRWRNERGYMIRLGQARALFFSTAPGASIVGATASLLMEVDEAQDVDAARYDKDLSPMASSTNATRVLYGTAWDNRTLLARQIRANQEAEARDGRRRHFAFPWWVVAESNPAYGTFVQTERARLGPEHPMFVTQFELREIGQDAGLFSRAMVEAMRGDHPRREQAEGDGVWVAGLDVAGGSEEVTDELARERAPRQDSTVLLVGRVEWIDVGEDARERLIRVEGVTWWTGRRHRDQLEGLVRLLREWRVTRVAVDSTGLGQPLAEFLTATLGEERVKPVSFTSQRKSDLGFDLVAAASGRFKWYAHGPNDREAMEWWHEVEACRREVRPNQQLRWSVPELAGHDDFISAAALLVHAASSMSPPAASRIIAAADPYGDPGR